MISDRNKDIAQIYYNHLNLPTRVRFSDSHIAYLYTATGNKVRKEVKHYNINIYDLTDYLGGYQYLNGHLQYFPTAEGYVDHTKVQGSSVYNYIYQYKDHLGNIRMNYTFDAVNGDIKITEESHYYPFGLKHRNYNNAEFQYREFNAGVRLLNRDKPPIIIDPNPFVKGEYNYKYNGKEWQDELGLNFYNYGWRNYDPAIGRWVNVDPLLNDLDFAFSNSQVDTDDADEVYSALITKLNVGGGIYNTNNLNPYVYGYNNPIAFDDPDGRCPSCDNDPDPISDLLSWTDVDDVAVAVTAITRGVFGMYDGKPKHIDGTDASISDTGFLVAGALIPVVSGGTVKKIYNKAGNLFKKDPGLGNQFKNKTLNQVTKAMDKQVKKGKLEAKPSAPGNKAYQNKKSKYSYNVDPGKAGKKGKKEASHIDVNYPNPKPKNVPNKKKLWIKNEKSE